MTGDLEEMDRMIGGYLAFARGEGTEQAAMTDLTACWATSPPRPGAPVAWSAPRPRPACCCRCAPTRSAGR